MRAIRCRYDPYIQTRTRVEQLRRLGHSIDKVEFVVMGGTFLSLEQDYQDGFIMKLHDALSGHHSHSVEEAVKWRVWDAPHEVDTANRACRSALPSPLKRDLITV